MPSSMRHENTLPIAVADLHDTLCTEQYWRDLVTHVAPETSALESLTADGDTTQVALQQRIPAEKLPSMVSRIHHGDLIIHRTMAWGPLEGTVAHGTFSAQVEGAPASVEGTMTMQGSEDGKKTTVSYHGTTTVKIPLVGGRVESAINDNLSTLVDHEALFTADWVTGAN